MKRHFYLVLICAGILSACNSSKGEPKEANDIEPVVTNSTTNVYDLTQGQLVGLELTEALPLQTPVLTNEGLSLLPESINVPESDGSRVSFIDFDSIETNGNLVLFEASFIGKNLETNNSPAVIRRQMVRTLNNQIQSSSFGEMGDWDSSGPIDYQSNEFINSNRLNQFSIELQINEEGQTDANAGDIILSSVSLKSYQVTDNDWNNAIATLIVEDYIDTCEYDASLLEGDITLNQQPEELTAAITLRYDSTVISDFSVTSDPDEDTHLSGTADFNSAFHSGTYAANAYLETRDVIFIYVNLNDCFLRLDAYVDMSGTFGLDDYVLDYSVDFTSLVEINETSEHIQSISKPNTPTLTEQGLQLFPQGMTTLDTFSTNAPVLLPMQEIHEQAQIIQYDIDLTLSNFDFSQCEALRLQLHQESNAADESIHVIRNITSNGTSSFSIPYFLTNRIIGNQLNVTFNPVKCIGSVDYITPNIYIRSIASTLQVFDKHALSGTWNYILERDGLNCPTLTHEGEIVVNIGTENYLTLNDDSKLTFTVNADGHVQWTWDSDSNTQQFEQNFFFGNSLWSKESIAEGCNHRLLLYRSQ